MSAENVSDTIFDLISNTALGRYEPTSSAVGIAKEIESLPTSDFENAIYSLWEDLIGLAKGADENTQDLADLTIALSKQPDARDSDGRPVQLYGATVWQGMPMLGWKINEIWNSRSIPPTPDPTRTLAITHTTNAVRFTAQLIASNHPVFQPYRLQILWSFRTLEHPTTDPQFRAFRDLDIDIPSIHAIVSVLGNEIASWTDEFPGQILPDGRRGGAAPGKGGPLWDGKQGFDRERYEFWRGRLLEIGGLEEGVEEGVRRLAVQTAEMMEV